MPKVTPYKDPVGEMVEDLAREVYGDQYKHIRVKQVAKATGYPESTLRNDLDKHATIPLHRICAVANAQGYKIVAVRGES